MTVAGEEAHGNLNVNGASKTPAQVTGYMKEMASQVAASGKYFDSMKPPDFTGELKDFEAWHQRFEWFIGLKSAIFQCALRDWQNLAVGMSLAELGDHVAHRAQGVKVGAAFIKMAVELHGYL